MGSLTRFIATRLKLKVNESKSAVERPWKRKFLGFTFSRQSFRGRQTVKRKVAPKALERFKDKVRVLTRRTQGANVTQVVGRLNRYLKGWIQYFSFSEVKGDFKHLESWIKRKLRCMIWKQWATAKTARSKCSNGVGDHEIRAWSVAFESNSSGSTSDEPRVF